MNCEILSSRGELSLYPTSVTELYGYDPSCYTQAPSFFLRSWYAYLLITVLYYIHSRLVPDPGGDALTVAYPSIVNCTVVFSDSALDLDKACLQTLYTVSSVRSTSKDPSS